MSHRMDARQTRMPWFVCVVCRRRFRDEEPGVCSEKCADVLFGSDDSMHDSTALQDQNENRNGPGHQKGDDSFSLEGGTSGARGNDTRSTTAGPASFTPVPSGAMPPATHASAGDSNASRCGDAAAGSVVVAAEVARSGGGLRAASAED